MYIYTYIYIFFVGRRGPGRGYFQSFLGVCGVTSERKNNRFHNFNLLISFSLQKNVAIPNLK